MWADLQPPPPNSLCIPTLFNKLDAEVIGRTKALNSILEQRYQFQQRMLVKHYKRTITVFNREKEQSEQLLKRVKTRLPYMSQVPDLDAQDTVRFFRMAKDYVRRTPVQWKTFSNQSPSPTSSNSSSPTLSERSCDRPFCDRYFVHHYSAEVKRKNSKQKRRLTKADIQPFEDKLPELPELSEESESKNISERRRSVRFALPQLKKGSKASRRRSETDAQERRLSINEVHDYLRRSSLASIPSRRTSIVSMSP